jgi:hypothetical protein
VGTNPAKASINVTAKRRRVHIFVAPEVATV